MMSGPTTPTVPFEAGLAATGAAAGSCIDKRMSDITVPLTKGPPISQRTLSLLADLTATPRRAALATLWTVAVVIAAVTLLWQPRVLVRTLFGPAKVRCGLDVFVYGFPDQAVYRACRHAESARVAILAPCLLVAVAGMLAAVFTRTRGRRPPAGESLGVAVRHAPIQRALIVLAVVALLLGLYALRPVPVQLGRAGQLTTIRCGADSYYLKYPDPAVRAACRGGYQDRARLLLVSALFVLLGLVAAVHLALVSLQDPWARRRVVLGVAGGLFAAIALVAVLPATVRVHPEPAPVFARCGLDTYLAGHPDHAVQEACRSHFGAHAATGAAAATLGAVFGVGASAAGRRRRSQVRSPWPVGDT